MPFWIRHAIARATYTICWILLRPVFRFFFDYKVINSHLLREINTPVIIAANHASSLDGFFIGTAFPLFSPVLPIHFATAPEHFWRPHFFPILWLLGGFPIYKKIGLESALRYPLGILKRGGSIGIFPEGKRVIYGRPPRGRRGVAYLSLVAEAPILPIYIEGSRGMTLRRMLARDIKIRVVVGNPFTLPPALAHPSALTEASEYIMQSVRDVRRDD
ncbi:MAG: lysophospholipid acyltransferase family protein [Candidatus Yanofskybacteria bacterium]|nr:lysophospholipid acyltransferase family protein [Candidatus Yanofskybacteria bacterium]